MSSLRRYDQDTYELSARVTDLILTSNVVPLDIRDDLINAIQSLSLRDAYDSILVVQERSVDVANSFYGLYHYLRTLYNAEVSLRDQHYATSLRTALEEVTSYGIRSSAVVEKMAQGNPQYSYYKERVALFTEIIRYLERLADCIGNRNITITQLSSHKKSDFN